MFDALLVSLQICMVRVRADSGVTTVAKIQRH